MGAEAWCTGGHDYGISNVTRSDYCLGLAHALYRSNMIMLSPRTVDVVTD